MVRTREARDGTRKQINIADIAGIAWEAAAEAHDDIEELQATVKALRKEVRQLRKQLNPTEDIPEE
jgi:archaellum component FlaC